MSPKEKAEALRARKMLKVQRSSTELWRLYNEDPTVHAWLKMYFTAQCSYEEAVIGIIVNLEQEKKTYFNRCIDLQNQLPAKVNLKEEDHGIRRSPRPTTKEI